MIIPSTQRGHNKDETASDAKKEREIDKPRDIQKDKEKDKLKDTQKERKTN